MLKKLYMCIRAIPKTLYFNFKYLKLKDAIKIPIIVSHRVKLVNIKGVIKINAPLKLGMIKLGFFEPKLFDNTKIRTVWNNTGEIIFYGKASIGNGSIFSVSGLLELGNDFVISGHTQIECKKHIKFNDNVLIGWDCLFMDGDAHKIYNLCDQEKRTNEDRDIIIGKNVWFGARCTITKGASVGDNVVVASNSCVFGKNNTNNCVLGGYPLKILKQNICWVK